MPLILRDMRVHGGKFHDLVPPRGWLIARSRLPTASTLLRFAYEDGINLCDWH
jgi:hypothetical protein